MLTKKHIPVFILFICITEALIYLWSVWTTTFDRTNFFAIDPLYVFDKCARIAGRISAVLILIPLLMTGYYGLREIYHDEKKREAFNVFMTLFAFNHLIHFLFVFLRFKSHDAVLDIGENLHGFMTFICIVILPVFLWTSKKLNNLLYYGIIIHLFNVSYFINKTFWGKVKPDHAAYHNQFGVLVITAACLFILYRVIREAMAGNKMLKQDAL